jgi:NAD+ synthase (glutamine-hydrolysing)
VKAGENFFNLYNHDFLRVAVAIPEIRVADPAFNAARLVELMRQAVARKAILALFPELALSAYSCEDLFQQRALLDGCLDALPGIIQASESWPLISVIGMPLVVDHLLYNCAVVLCQGRILGVVPKTYLPNSFPVQK